MPDPPPECGTPCEAKVILNGGIAARVLDETCSTIYSYLEGGENHFPNSLKLVKMANEIENKVFEFSREVLEQIGFTGPWPNSMKSHSD